jgi:hypothetical protein
MPIFVVQHEHSAERCPARDPQMARMLLKHLSEENASKYGVRIKAEGVVDGSHKLYLIIEAEGRDNVSRFMEPFVQAGSVEIMQASPCEVVVERGGC